MAEKATLDQDLRVKRRKRTILLPQSGTAAGLAVLVLLVAMVFILGQAFGAEPVIPPGEGAVAEGQALYVRYCAACHARTGAGQPEAGIPPLNQDGQAWQRSKAELLDHILDGGETMPALSGLVAQEDAENILLFVQQWWLEEQIAEFESQNPNK